MNLGLHAHTTAEQLEMLAARQLDVGFLRLPSAAEGLELEQVLSEPSLGTGTLAVVDQADSD